MTLCHEMYWRFFLLAGKVPELQTTMAFCNCYMGMNTTISTYNQKSSCLGLIVEIYEKLIREAIIASR